MDCPSQTAYKGWSRSGIYGPHHFSEQRLVSTREISPRQRIWSHRRLCLRQFLGLVLITCLKTRCMRVERYLHNPVNTVASVK